MYRTIKLMLFISLFIISIFSCQKEISSDNGLLPTNNGNDSTNCKACTYYPYCTGSTYTYVDTTASGPVNTSATTITYVSDTTVDGKVYQRFSAPGTSADSYHNCTAGVTSVFAFTAPTNRVTTTILKANEPVGATWTDVNMNAGQAFNYDWEIVSKTLSRTVLGVTFNSVIHVHLSTNLDFLGSNLVVAESDYYFAPNVGLIENLSFDLTSGFPVLSLHRVLQSFYIP